MNEIKEYQNAVEVIKTAILQSQARALRGVNQEQLALYYGIGRYISENTRNKNWGTGAIETISMRLRQELPGLRGFSAPSLRKMRIFYEEWMMLERNSFVATNELKSSSDKLFVTTNEIKQSTQIHQFRLMNLQKQGLIRQFRLPDLHPKVKSANCNWQICLISLCVSS